MNFVMGVDLGQSQDYTAIVVSQYAGAHCSCDGRCYHHRILFSEELNEWLKENVCTCRPVEGALQTRFIERLPLGTRYPRIVEHVGELLRQSILLDSTELIIDYTGVGHPVVDMFLDAGFRPIAVNLTGGNRVTQEPDTDAYNVPKRDVVAALLVMFQTGILKVSTKLELANTLIKELQAFRVKIDKTTAHDQYGAWRSGEHDDLVLAQALSAWWVKYMSADPVRTIRSGAESDLENGEHVVDELDLVHELALKERS